MVKMVGAKPIYCDCAEGSVNPGVAELAEKATPRTKAVIVCHTYGAVSERFEVGSSFKDWRDCSVMCSSKVLFKASNFIQSNFSRISAPFCIFFFVRKTFSLIYLKL